MRIRHIAAAAAALALGLGLAGCGGGGDPASSTPGGAASIVPTDAVAFAAIETSAPQSVSDLFAKLPAHDALVQQLQQAFRQKTGLDWQTDVQPALGTELDVAVLPGAKPEVVGLTQPSDASKLSTLLQTIGTKTGTTIVTGTAGGWTVFSDSKGAVDAVTGAATHLSDNNTYQEATSKLDSDALASVYVNGGEAQQLAQSLGVKTPSRAGAVAWAAGDAVVSGSTLTLHGWAGTSGTTEQPYASALAGQIPSDVLAAVDFQAPSGAGSTGTTLPKPVRGLLPQLRTALGGETALYVSGGLPPSVTLVTHPADPQAAHAAIDQAFASLAAGHGLGAFLKPPFPYKVLSGGTLVVSTSAAGLQTFPASSGLTQNDAFTVPGETTGFAYVDLADALPFVQMLLPATGSTMKLPDLTGLDTLTAWGDRSGGVSSGTVVLSVK